MAFAETGDVAPRNALISKMRPTAFAPRRAPVDLAPLLASTIGHAALLSDTPEKWASTITMLRQNGVDPEGYADFENGRRAAINAAGIKMPDGKSRSVLLSTPSGILRVSYQAPRLSSRRHRLGSKL